MSTTWTTTDVSYPERSLSRPPTHPGAVLRLDVLPALGLTQGQLAERLGVSRLTVSQVLNEHRSVSAALAVKLEGLLDIPAEQWLSMQQALDLWQARRLGAEQRTSSSPEVTAETVDAIDKAKRSSRAMYTEAGAFVRVAQDGSAVEET
jgi:addiction module HigA family antidote